MVHFYKFLNELYILFNQLLTIFINNHFINLYFLIFPICKIKSEKKHLVLDEMLSISINKF